MASEREKLKRRCKCEILRNHKSLRESLRSQNLKQNFWAIQIHLIYGIWEVKKVKLDNFEERIGKLNGEIERLKIHQQKYEETIQILTQENLSLLEMLPEQAEGPLSVKERLIKVTSILQKKWDKWFEINEEEDYIKIQARETRIITDDILIDFTEDLVQECSKQKLWEQMERLEIQIDGPNSITDQGLKTFSSQLGPKLSNMRHLVLDMDSWEEITDEGLKEFAVDICSCLGNVECLELDMGGWSQITDKGMKIFAGKLGAQLNKSLRSLTLGMDDWNEVTDEGLKALTSQFALKLVETERIILGMNNWSLITNNGLNILTSQVLSQLENVKHLELDMGEWSEITDEGLEIFASQLGPQLKEVEYLVLGMHNWSFITDEGMSIFALKLLSQIGKERIEYLELDIGNWKKITDKGLMMFASQLGDVNDLQLNIENLKKITSQGIEGLVSRIVKNMASLEELGLYLGEKFVFMKENLNNKLQKIPKVNIFCNQIDKD